MAVDPVCGGEVDPATCPLRAVYGGRVFYFCSSRCKDAFDRDAARYARGEGDYGPYLQDAPIGP